MRKPRRRRRTAAHHDAGRVGFGSFRLHGINQRFRLERRQRAGSDPAKLRRVRTTEAPGIKEIERTPGPHRPRECPCCHFRRPHSCRRPGRGLPHQHRFRLPEHHRAIPPPSRSGRWKTLRRALLPEFANGQSAESVSTLSDNTLGPPPWVEVSPATVPLLPLGEAAGDAFAVRLVPARRPIVALRADLQETTVRGSPGERTHSSRAEAEGEPPDGAQECQEAALPVAGSEAEGEEPRSFGGAPWVRAQAPEEAERKV